MDRRTPVTMSYPSDRSIRTQISRVRVLWNEQNTPADIRHIQMARYLCAIMHIPMTPLRAPRPECIFLLRPHLPMDLVRIVFQYSMEDSEAYPRIHPFPPLDEPSWVGARKRRLARTASSGTKHRRTTQTQSPPGSP